jgi:hypothetical protein
MTTKLSVAAAHGWLYFPLLKKLTDTQFILMTYLLNKKPADSGEWFQMTNASIQENIGWHEEKQKRVFRELQSLGLINTAKKGNPAKRHVRINDAAFCAILGIETP